MTRSRTSEEVVAVSELDLRIVADRLVPTLHAAVEREAQRDARRLLDLPSGDPVGIERVAVLHDHRDPDARRRILVPGVFAVGQLYVLVRALVE